MLMLIKKSGILISFITPWQSKRNTILSKNTGHRYANNFIQMILGMWLGFPMYI